LGALVFVVSDRGTRDVGNTGAEKFSAEHARRVSGIPAGRTAATTSLNRLQVAADAATLI
jgi:hypothetical protein